MKVEQNKWTEEKGWRSANPGELSESADLILLFGARSVLAEPGIIEQVRSAYPKARLFGCSTAGEILGTEVSEESLTITAISFDHTEIAGVRVPVERDDSFEAGARLARAVKHDGLRHLLVLSDGLRVNGSQLVKGIARHLPPGATVTGGLSGDGELFGETLVLLDGAVESGIVAAIAFYGERLQIGCSSFGGWNQFGPERVITKSHANVLYELDGKSALNLYKNYLGEHAKDLPASGLFFPLGIRSSKESSSLVRTILSVNEEDQSLTFAGDVPEGFYARLMKANLDRLIDGAVTAARASLEIFPSDPPDLAILINCIGRRLILKQRAEEEIEGVREVMGNDTCLAGFYSYGEISPFLPETRCELHNETMTITTLAER